MPSIQHELLVDFFRQNPGLLLDLLAHSLGISLPRYNELRIAEADLTQLQPVEARADLVLVFCLSGQPIYALVVEVQLAQAPVKKRVWPLYWAAGRCKLGCPVSVVVVATSEGVATWAGQPIDDDNPGGGWLQPLVLGPGQVPVVTSADQAGASLDLTMLSLLAHEQGPELISVAAAALSGLAQAGLPESDEKLKLYYHVITLALKKACRAGRLEQSIMESLLEKYRDEFKEVYDFWEARGEARSIVKVLRARGLEASEDAANRILSCKDPVLLDRWLMRAMTVLSVDEIFSDS